MSDKDGFLAAADTIRQYHENKELCEKNDRVREIVKEFATANSVQMEAPVIVGSDGLHFTHSNGRKYKLTIEEQDD